MAQEAQDQGLQNKAVPGGAAGSGQSKDQTAPETSSDEAGPAAQKLVDDAVEDATELVKDGEADAVEVVEGKSNLLTAARNLEREAVADGKDLLHDAAELGRGLVEDVEEKLGFGDPDAEHDAALRAQYDTTADLAARGGDSAANR